MCVYSILVGGAGMLMGLATQKAVDIGTGTGKIPWIL